MESRLIVAGLVLLLAGCRPRPAATATISVHDTTSAERPPEGGRPSSRPSVVFLGTSLTAGLGVDPDQAYPALIQKKADSAGILVTVENRGVSGETSAGALARLGWLLQEPPAVIVIETGANDGLRGQDPDSTRATIQAIIDRIRARDSSTRIVLVGMEAMPNLGRRYVTRFHSIYPELAQKNHLLFMPFLLTGVAGVDTLNQGDGIHPNPRGHQIVADNVWKVIRPALERVARRP
jgi:acyl-CoA thioesterase-1